MKHLPDAVREGLALGDEDVLEPIMRCEPPNRNVGHGRTLAAPAEAPDLDQLVRTQLVGRTFAQERQEPGLGRWLRDAYDESLVLLETAEPALQVFGSYRDYRGSWLLYTATEPAYVHAFVGDRELLFEVDAGVVKVDNVRRSASRHLCQLTGEAPELPQIVPPSVEALLGGLAAQPWLIETSQRLARSPDPLDRVASPGLVARLWALAPGATGESALEAVLAGAAPTERVRVWAHKLPAADRAVLESLAVSAAYTLADSLPSVGATLGAAPLVARRLALSLARRRDDLESVRLVLATAGDVESLAEALAAVDEVAAEQASAFAFLDDLGDDERLVTVSWKEPLAWWGALATS
jgi:hypothetical protein